MSRIKALEEFVSPAYFAYKERDDGNRLTNHEFERVGGGRQLIYCEWNEEEIDKLSLEEFNRILMFLKVINELEKKYKGMSLIDFLNSFSTKT